MIINKETRKWIIFSLTMGITATGIITFILIAINSGFNSQFLYVWFKSWMTAYLVIIPIIFIVAPFLWDAINNY